MQPPPRIARRLLAAVLSALLLAACGRASDSGIRSQALDYRGHAYQVVVINTGKARLALYWRNPETRQAFADIDGLKAWGEQHGRTLLFATNAGIYDHKRAPLGLYVENGKTLVPLNTAHGNPAHGNFSLLPNGVFAIDMDGRASVHSTRDWQKLHIAPRWATQSGPMLVIDGQINPGFRRESDSVRWRSGVCARKPHEVVFAISKTPVNFHAFASLFRDRLGCRNALYLDGTLSQMYADGERYGPPGFMVKPWAGMFGVFAKGEPQTRH